MLNKLLKLSISKEDLWKSLVWLESKTVLLFQELLRHNNLIFAPFQLNGRHLVHSWLLIFHFSFQSIWSKWQQLGWDKTEMNLMFSSIQTQVVKFKIILIGQCGLEKHGKLIHPISNASTQDVHHKAELKINKSNLF